MSKTRIVIAVVAVVVFGAGFYTGASTRSADAQGPGELMYAGQTRTLYGADCTIHHYDWSTSGVYLECGEPFVSPLPTPATVQRITFAVYMPVVVKR